MFLILFACLFISGCGILPVFQRTPLPLETATPRLSLNQVTDIPTLPPVTPTPTLSDNESVRYEAPSDIFTQVTEEILPLKAWQKVVLFGSVDSFTVETDVWGRTAATGGFTLDHHSGTDFEIICDDFCFYIDARKNLISSDKMTEGSEVIVFGAAGEEPTVIRADMIAVHVLREDPVPHEADVSGLPNTLIYTEYEMEGFPHLNPISIRAAAATSTPIPPPTQESSEPTADPYAYDYGYTYDYYYYGRPTSTPNRPQRTPTPDETGTPVPTATLSLDDRLTDRLTHSLEGRSSYSIGSYGEFYSVYMEYDQDLNRDPSYPTRALMNIMSNGYDFTEYWIPYTQNPMFSNWGIICYGGDWYLPMRITVDIDPDPVITDLVFTDRTIRSNQNYDKERGYIRSFGYSILNRQFFYFYQNENGYGFSINKQDYDLGFDDIPFGYVSTYSEIDPFYSDDLITFFGHRGDRWYYVELRSE
ncbi:MAG: hypothetical protein IKP86_12305 [Anaerolineaceae bacterium]|nr:hypothetical protein [Anaerolineaceae bacterium]